MISRDGDRLLLSGPLTQKTVRALFDGGLQPNGQSSLIVDLSKVDAVDSSAIGLLLAWVRAAQRNNIKLCFAHMPDNLLSLASLYGVAEMLPACIDVSMQS